MKRWTQQETQLLIEKYPTIGLKETARLLGRGCPSIRQKASQLGLKQDISSDFFRDWQKRARDSKVGKANPSAIKTAKRNWKEGKFNGNSKHGLSYEKGYSIWLGIMHRCYRKEHASYPNYGALGVTVCNEWHNPKNFIDWFKENNPSLLTIDRIDPFGNYEPSNCRFISVKEQARNKRRSVLSYEKVEVIRNLYIKGMGQSDIGRKVGVSNKLVHLVVKGQIWN